MWWTNSLCTLAKKDLGTFAEYGPFTGYEPNDYHISSHIVQVSTTQFCCFPPVLMARTRDGTDVPVSPVPASSSNMGSPNGSLPDLEGTGYRASTMEEKINEMFVQIAKLPLLLQNVSRFENCVQTLSQTVASKMRKLRILNKWLAALQPVLPHWKRMQQPSPVDPARQDLGTCLDRVPAPQPLGPSGPMALDHLMIPQRNYKVDQ